ncbi:MAG TPA: HAD family hydrolase [Gammaproteobacteria bacterium]|nr:HAD family hydrolase [Gammaproteobacteria bacterium]
MTAAIASERAVFLDKDGTLLDDVPYNVDPSRIALAPGAAEGVRLLAAAGLPLVVVTNQGGVARGLFPESALARVERRIAELLSEVGAALAGFYYCPHDPRGSVAPFNRACGCRKPAPGLLHDAARDLGIALDRAWLVGDILDDVEAGRRAGCRTILLDRGNETEWRVAPERVPDHVAADLLGAAQIILAAENGVRPDFPHTDGSGPSKNGVRPHFFAGGGEGFSDAHRPAKKSAPRAQVDGAKKSALTPFSEEPE